MYSVELPDYFFGPPTDERIVGSITTDGTIGLITAANVIAWNLSVKDKSTGLVHWGPYDVVGMGVFCGPIDCGVTATANDLIYDSLTPLGQLVFYDPNGPFPHTGGDTIAFWPEGPYVNDSTFFHQRTNPYVIGSVDVSPPLPEPATLALLGLGLVGLGFSRRKQ